MGDKDVQDAHEEQKEKTHLEKIQAQAEEYLDGWKRAKADYINLKKDTEKRLSETVQFANAALILEMLPVNDHLKLAMEHIPEKEKEKEWVKGIIHIQKEFSELLGKMGIEEIETVGKTFDPELHEAVTREKIEGATPNTIVKELAPGYKLFNKVLQVAKVHVAE